MNPVKKSVLAPYFDEVSEVDLQGVELLTSAEAAEVWAENFDRRAKGLYDLPDDSWVAKGSWSIIGNWIGPYNELASSGKIEEAVVNTSNWSLDEPLFFVQSSQQVVALELQGFLKCWQELVSAFDDGPILMARRGGRTAAFRFAPLGQVLFATRN